MTRAALLALSLLVLGACDRTHANGALNTCLPCACAKSATDASGSRHKTRGNHPYLLQ